MNVGKLREQLRGNTSCGLPNETLFFDLDLASQFVYAGVADYNTARPLSSLACKTPAAYADPRGATTVKTLIAAG